jgi:hypothetical protein
MPNYTELSPSGSRGEGSAIAAGESFPTNSAQRVPQFCNSIMATGRKGALNMFGALSASSDCQ